MGVCQVCPERHGLEFWLYLLCLLLLRPDRCHAQLVGTKEDKGFDLKCVDGSGRAHQVELLNDILDLRLYALQEDHNLLIAAHWATWRT